MKFLSAVRFILPIFLVVLQVKGQSSDMEKLKKELLARNPTEHRPVSTDDKPLTLRFALAPRRVTLDDHKQEMSVETWSFMSWTDTYMTWEPQDFGGITDVHLAAEDIWLPDIAIFNRIFSTSDTHFGTVPVLVTFDGRVMWFPPTFATVPCSIDLKLWPRDTHNCTLKIGSWTHHGGQINIEKMANGTGILIENYIPGNDWLLADYSAYKKVQYINGTAHMHLEFHFVVTRMAMEQVGYIFTAIIVSALCMISAYFLPYCHYVGRILLHIFSLAILIASLFLLYVSLPSIGGPIPIVVRYFRGSVVLASISLLMNLFICNMSSDDSWIYDAVSALGRSAKKESPSNYSILQENYNGERSEQPARSQDIEITISPGNGETPPSRETPETRANNTATDENILQVRLHQKKHKEMLIAKYTNLFSLVAISTALIIDFIMLNVTVG